MPPHHEEPELKGIANSFVRLVKILPSLALSVKGLSAYEIAVADGFVGDETAWLASLEGADGAPGVSGAASAVLVDAKVNEAAGISNGDVVFISGATGGLPQVSLASNDVFTEAHVIAIAAETRSNGQTIVVITNGLLENVDTSGYAEGAILYLGTGGAYTDVHPTANNAVQRIGNVVKVNPVTGSILVALDALTIIDSLDGFVRTQVVNTNAGTSAIVNGTYINDAGHYLSINMQGSNNSFGASEASLYNSGHGSTKYIVDGNKDHIWHTDVSDSHNSSFTEKMKLSAAGNLTLSGTVDGRDVDADGTVLDGLVTSQGTQDTAIGLNTAKTSYTDAAAVSANTTHSGSTHAPSTAEVNNVKMQGTAPATTALWFHTTDLIFYAYDSARSDWLSVDEHTVAFNYVLLAAISATAIFEFGRTSTFTSSKRGFPIPFDCTVTGLEWRNVNDTSGHRIRLCIYDESASASNTTYFSTYPAGTGNVYGQHDLDLDYDRGDSMGAIVQSGTAATQYQTLTVTYRRRPS